MSARTGRPGRGPGGAVVLGEVKRALAKGWPAGLTVLTGDDLYHLDRAQRMLLEALVPAEATEFALTVFAGEERVDAGVVVSAARSVGMFADRRVVLLRDLAMLEGEPDSLVEFAAAPPPRSHLIVRAPALDRRRKLHKALARSGKLLEFSAGDPGRLAGEVRAIAESKELRLEPRAVQFLAAVCGGDLYRVDSELDKLRAWLGEEPRRELSLESLRGLVSGGELLSSWELADAVLERDLARALAAARRTLEAGAVPVMVIGGLAARARAMLQAALMLEAGHAPGRIPQAVGAWAFADRLIEGVRRYTVRELLAFPSLLAQADRTLKSRGIDPRFVLEQLVERMIGTQRAAAGRR